MTSVKRSKDSASGFVDSVAPHWWAWHIAHSQKKLMYLYHSYSRKIETAGALTRYTEYKKPVFMFRDPDRPPRFMNPNTPRSDFAVSRTRYTVYHLIRCNQQRVNIFVTLTYAANMKDLKQAKLDFNLFIKNLNYETKTQTKYICIPERQKRGAIHFHCLFFGLPYRPLGVFKSLWPHGDARFERSKQLRSIASYVAKYVTKKTFDFPKGTRILMRSRNLVIPTTIIEGLAAWPDVIDYRQPVEITTGVIKDVKVYDSKERSIHYRKNYKAVGVRGTKRS